MLDRIEIKDFKAHADTEIEVRPLTVFIGPNNSGKSSLGQALLLLKQATIMGGSALCRPAQRKGTSAADPYLYPEDQIIDLGDFSDVVRRGEREIKIGLTGVLVPGWSYGPLRVHLELRFAERGLEGSLYYHRGTIEFRTPPPEMNKEVTWLWGAGQAGRVFPVRLGDLQLNLNPNGTFEALLGSGGIQYPHGIDQAKVLEAQTIVNGLISAPRSLISSVHPIFPLRGLEERGAPLTDNPARSLERISVADRTVALLSMLAYDQDLQDRISTWLENLIGRHIRVPLLPGKRVTLRSIPAGSRGGDSLFLNEGTGANQLPFILVPIGVTPETDTILLTEPEAHLHPKLQSKLASLLLRLVQEERRQFVIETHSEHVLHTVLSAVAKGEILPENLAIYYFENKNGVAEARRLEVSEKGQVDGGLPGFFEQSVQELSDYLEALKKN